MRKRSWNIKLIEKRPIPGALGAAVLPQDAAHRIKRSILMRLWIRLERPEGRWPELELDSGLATAFGMPVWRAPEHAKGPSNAPGCSWKGERFPGNPRAAENNQNKTTQTKYGNPQETLSQKETVKEAAQGACKIEAQSEACAPPEEDAPWRGAQSKSQHPSDKRPVW